MLTLIEKKKFEVIYKFQSVRLLDATSGGGVLPCFVRYLAVFFRLALSMAFSSPSEKDILLIYGTFSRFILPTYFRFPLILPLSCLLFHIYHFFSTLFSQCNVISSLFASWAHFKAFSIFVGKRQNIMPLLDY
jgi:hypothetical protein